MIHLSVPKGSGKVIVIYDSTFDYGNDKKVAQKRKNIYNIRVNLCFGEVYE